MAPEERLGSTDLSGSTSLRVGLSQTADRQALMAHAVTTAAVGGWGGGGGARPPIARGYTAGSCISLLLTLGHAAGTDMSCFILMQKNQDDF